MTTAVDRLKRVMPEPIKAALRPLGRRWRCWSAVVTGSAPPGADLVGYETLVEFILERGLERLPGDFLEVGAFLGGGTCKLGKLAKKCGKTVWVVDVFDPSFDTTRNVQGQRMSDVYYGTLAGRSQEEIFYRLNRRNLGCLRVLKGDSQTVQFPSNVRFAFGFVDGDHNAAWVENDFRLVWSRLQPGGAVGFHDYGGDLPQVTEKIDELIAAHRGRISDVLVLPDKRLVFLTKASDASER